MAIDAIEGSELGEVAQQDVAGGAGVSSCHVIAQRRTASIHFSTSQLPVDRPAAPTGLARVVLSDDDHSASGILPRLMDQALSETEVRPVVHHPRGPASDAPLLISLGHS